MTTNAAAAVTVATGTVKSKFRRKKACPKTGMLHKVRLRAIDIVSVARKFQSGERFVEQEGERNADNQEYIGHEF